MCRAGDDNQTHGVPRGVADEPVIKSRASRAKREEGHGLTPGRALELRQWRQPADVLVFHGDVTDPVRAGPRVSRLAPARFDLGQGRNGTESAMLRQPSDLSW
jgi:hypothetical protein